MACLLHTPSWNPSGAGLRGAIVAHGHGGDWKQANQGFYFGGHCEQLADKGYAVLAVSTGDTWANATAVSKIAVDGAGYLLNTVVVSGTKVAGIGSSMGGLNLLRSAAENPALFNALVLFSPALSLDYNETVWTAEIQALYGGSHSTYLTQGSPRSPLNTPTLFRSQAKVLIVHPTDDGTIPYSQSQAFVAAVNDPGVTLRSPDVTGGHIGGQLAVLPRESWEFIRANWS